MCASALACTALQMLAGDRGVSALMHTLLAVFFCCCMVGPLGAIATASWPNWLPDASANLPETSTEWEAAYIEACQQQADKAVERLAEQALSDSGYEIEKIQTNWAEDRSGSIYVDGVTVWLDASNSARSPAIVRLIQEALGVSVTVRPLLEGEEADS